MNTTDQSPYFTLTARELRSILYDLDNQEMTIKELREALFNLKADLTIPAINAVDLINQTAKK